MVSISNTSALKLDKMGIPKMKGQETKKMKDLPQKSKIFFLVGGWTTHLKIISQLGNLLQISGWK